MFFYLKSKKVSMRKVAKEIGVSNAYLTMVIKGKRNFDLRYLEAIADYFQLNISERSYLKNLIIICDHEDSRTRSEAYKKLARFRSYKTQQKDDVIFHKYLDNWYYVAIRELSFSEGFKEDPFWIQEKFLPKLKIREIENALAFLKKHGLLATEDDNHLNCSEGLYKLTLTNFHQDMLGIISESIPKVKRDYRNILGFTKSLDKKSFEKAKDIMAKALKDLEELDVETNKTELYHFYLLASPLTLSKEKKNEES